MAQQQQFIADAAHELRTPLTALRLQLQLAERAADPSERARAFAALREGIARASRMVEQLLTLARSDPDAPATPLAPVDIADIAREVAGANELAARAKGLDMVVDAQAPLVVEGDRAALRAMTENLVDNAIRYTAEGSIRVGATRRDSQAVLTVEDTGPGIPKAERERVFDRFFRGETATEPGTGLGLAIVRRVAERHGAKVTLAEGREGRGLRVEVALRLA
jgi:two-component system OmpR family sensor kinase